jgi:hypothetical protein
MTPLHILIAIHYYTSPGNYAEGTPHCRSSATREYTQHLIDAGLLRPTPGNERGDYEATDACKVWIDALCAVPFPVRQWVVPK